MKTEYALILTIALLSAILITLVIGILMYIVKTKDIKIPVRVKFEDKETLEWIMRCFVEAIIEGYTAPSLAIDRAIKYYDLIMKQVNGKSYRELYDAPEIYTGQGK